MDKSWIFSRKCRQKCQAAHGVAFKTPGRQEKYDSLTTVDRTIFLRSTKKELPKRNREKGNVYKGNKTRCRCRFCGINFQKFKKTYFIFAADHVSVTLKKS